MTWWPFLLINTVIAKLSSLLPGNIDVYICPGDHLALGEPEDGAVVGGILATAVSVRYRTQDPLSKSSSIAHILETKTSNWQI